MNTVYLRCLVMTACILFIGGHTGCKREAASNASATPPKAVTVKTSMVQKKTLTKTIDLTGEVVASNSVIISSTAEGPIAYCPWREGDQVARSGEKLIEIARASYRAEVQAAKASLSVARAKLADMEAGTRPEEIAQAKELVKKLEESSAFAQSDVNRTMILVNRQGLPGEALEKAKVVLIDQITQLETARYRLAMLQSGATRTQILVAKASEEEAAARVALAEAKLNECVINAPFSGIVSRVYVRTGDMATPKMPLLELYAPESLVIRFSVPESQAATLAKGMAVVMSFDALPGRTVPGKLVRIYPDMDRRMRTRTVEAIPDVPISVVPGMFARVRLTLVSLDNALAVPTDAVLVNPDQKQVVFAVRDGKARRQPIKSGISENGWTQVLDGANVGESVIVGGLGRIKDGMAVSTAALKIPATSRPSVQTTEARP